MRYKRLGLARPAGAILLWLIGVLCGGCAGRFTAKTEYLAAGFTRDALRGRTVAVLPEAPEAGGRDGASFGPAVDGVASGIREAGARVRVVSPADPSDADEGTPRPASDVDAAYLLVVRLVDVDEYRRYAPHAGGFASAPAATRTSGRRMRIRLALLRLPDRAAVWLATGRGEMWNKRTVETIDGAPADASVHQDLFRNADLYPAPPGARVVSSRLTRRLLADVPPLVELQPN